MVEVYAPIKMNSSCEQDHEMPHLVAASPDIEFIREVTLWEASDVDQRSYDVAGPTNGEVGRWERIEQLSISKINSDYL